MSRGRRGRPRKAWLAATLCAIVALASAGVSIASSGGGVGAAAVKEPSLSLFGLNAYTVDTNRNRIARDIPTAKAMGARLVHFTPSYVGFADGKPDFSILDANVNRARKRGLGVLISLGGIPTACSLEPRPKDITTAR